MTTFANPKARWDYRFARPDYIFGTDPNAFLASQKDRLPQGKALAVADGEGRNSVWLAEHPRPCRHAVNTPHRNTLSLLGASHGW